MPRGPSNTEVFKEFMEREREKPRPIVWTEHPEPSPEEQAEFEALKQKAADALGCKPEDIKTMFACKRGRR